MKAKISTTTFFILLLLMVIDASAQTKFGIRGGVNFGNLVTTINPEFVQFVTTESTNNHKSGLVAGVILESRIFKSISIQTELQFIRKGNIRHTVTDQGAHSITTTTINNIDLPVHLKYNFSISEKLDAFVMAGPYVGFLHSAEKERCEGNNCETNGLLFIPEYEDYDDLEMNRGDIGLSFGTGIVFNDRLFLDLRYVVGSRNIWYSDTFFTTKTNGFQIGLGYFLKR